MKKLTILAISCMCMLTACTSNEEKADALLKRATATFRAGDFNLAKLQIDSIRTLYPRETEARKLGVALMQQIELAEQDKSVAFLQKALNEQQAILDSLQTSFVLEKDTAYQEVGNYFYPSQIAEKNVGRSYLRAKVSEQGHMSLTSVYCAGGKMHHKRIKVTFGELYAESPVSTDTYEMQVGGRIIELADYPQSNDGGIIHLLLMAKPEDRVKLEFVGDKSYTTFLTPDDIRAVSAIARLGEVLTTIGQIQKQQKEANLKTRFLKQRMSELQGK